jgi:hypothetical protein
MGALRYLARGVTFDDLAELSDVGESTLNTFAHEYYSLKAGQVCHCKYTSLILQLCLEAQSLWASLGDGYGVMMRFHLY